MHEFMEMLPLSDKRLVHSQKNHSLAFNFADLFIFRVQQNKRRYMFYNEKMICIKNIQIVRLLLSRQFEISDL